MKTFNYIVLNPVDSTYELKRATRVQALADELGCPDVEMNGTYIAHNSPKYQVICVSTTDVYDLRENT